METDKVFIRLRFYHDPLLVRFRIKTSATVGDLVSDIIEELKPRTTYCEPYMGHVVIREKTMLLFKGKDLRKADASCTLREFGVMGYQAEIFIIVPGVVLSGSQPHMSSALRYQAEDVFEAVTESPIDRVEELIKSSLDRKIILVDVPISGDMDVEISVHVRLQDQIVKVKQCIEDAIVMKTCSTWNGWRDCLSLRDFNLFSLSTELDPELTLADYDIKENDVLNLSWEVEQIQVVMPRHLSSKMECCTIDMYSLDTVKMVKARIHQITQIPEGIQTLKHQQRMLTDDSKSLVECGCSFRFGEPFQWCPQPHMTELQIVHPLPACVSLSEACVSGDFRLQALSS